MIEGLDKLFYYFGSIGIASIGCWALAALIVLVFACRLLPVKVLVASVPIAIAGLVLASINSGNINEIQIDFSAEIEAARRRSEEMKQKERLEPLLPEYGAGAESRPAGEKPKKYSYRDRGKIDRTAGSKKEDQTLKKEFTDKPQVQGARIMSLAEVEQANGLDRINLNCARVVLGLSLFSVLLSYVMRFNRTFQFFFPLPLAGRWIDAISRKTLSICICRHEGDFLPKLLEKLVRKGETFICFTEKDPWSQASLPRLPKPLASFRRLKKLTPLPTDACFDAEFIFESAWHGRYCFVIQGPLESKQLLSELLDFLKGRHATMASTFRTLNVAWDTEFPIPRENLEKIIALCKEANVRFIVSAPPQEFGLIKKLFDERHPPGS